MRTWLLAPDGVWSEVTHHLEEFGQSPVHWPWDKIVHGIDCVGVESSEPIMFTRSDLAAAHGTLHEQWIGNRVWGTLCARGVDQVTVMRVSAPPGCEQPWLEALQAFAGRDPAAVGSAHYQWAERHARWLLWAHAYTDIESEIDGARIVVGCR